MHFYQLDCEMVRTNEALDDPQQVSGFSMKVRLVNADVSLAPDNEANKVSDDKIAVFLASKKKIKAK